MYNLSNISEVMDSEPFFSREIHVIQIGSKTNIAMTQVLNPTNYYKTSKSNWSVNINKKAKCDQHVYHVVFDL